MRILMVTNKVKTFALGFQNVLEPLYALGHEVVWAADFSGFVGDRSEITCETRQISIHTNPFRPQNSKAYKQLLAIIDHDNIEGVVCSTPIGGALARLAAKKKNIRPVIYEAHGFLFFKGAPFINRTLYRLEEEVLAHYTDTLITITKEDYEAAKKMRLRNRGKAYLVHGAGVKAGVEVSCDKAEKRAELGIPEDAFMIVSAGELNKNKNTEVMVKALASFKGENVYYAACGVGPEEAHLRELAADCGIEDQFILPGYRTDMSEVMHAADCFVMMSFREGMPRSVLEAMDLGLPCIGSRTRGINDLIDEGEGGFLCDPRRSGEFADAIRKLRADAKLREKMGEHNRLKVKDYSVDIVRSELTAIYAENLK